MICLVCCLRGLFECALKHYSCTLKFPIFSLILLILTLSDLAIQAESKTYWADVDVLKELKDAVDSGSITPGSCLSSWDFTVDPCDNLFSQQFSCGFRCDTIVSNTSRVTELSLDQAGYSGSLTSVSWNLPYLQTLDLSSNYFRDQIPDSLSNLTQLTRLTLSRNLFSGQIPNSLASLSNLQELYLDNNNLQGPIPSNFNNLISLKRLEIQSNTLTGEIPELGHLQNLNFLDASDNAISGNIPISLPSSILEISMRNNSLQGEIPQSFKFFSNLQVLDLSYNNLTGALPLVLFTHPSLQQLTLSSNHFTSVQSPSSPPFIGTMTIQSELIAVDLSNNDLQGFLPFFLSLMPKLSALSLENNKFSGMIPTQYAIKAVLPEPGLSPFVRLLLGGNYLYGPIPGPLVELKPGSVDVTLAGNCLYRCPVSFFFCQGGDQKSLTECKTFSPFIP